MNDKGRYHSLAGRREPSTSFVSDRAALPLPFHERLHVRGPPSYELTEALQPPIALLFDLLVIFANTIQTAALSRVNSRAQ
jgi:hypothetical protein